MEWPHSFEAKAGGEVEKLRLLAFARGANRVQTLLAPLP